MVEFWFVMSTGKEKTTLIITEKPAVAAKIAAALSGATDEKITNKDKVPCRTRSRLAAQNCFTILDKKISRMAIPEIFNLGRTCYD